jgi:hypothetical protein
MDGGKHAKRRIPFSKEEDQSTSSPQTGSRFRAHGAGPSWAGGRSIGRTRDRSREGMS